MPSLQSLSDFDLQQLLANGEIEAFNELYRRYVNPVKGFLIKFLHSKVLSEDVSQDIFINLWNNSSKLKQVQSFKAYLFTVARNKALDSLKSTLRADAAMNEVFTAITQHRNSLEEEQLNKEYLLFLERTLNTIPQRSREIFALCREQGKTYDEAAAELGLSRNAIKNHMVFTMKVLRSKAESELGISLSVLLAVLLKR